MWDKPKDPFTEGVKNITEISKLAAENDISQSNVQTATSYWIQQKCHERPSFNEKARIYDYFAKKSTCVIRNNDQINDKNTVSSKLLQDALYLMTSVL